MKRLGIDFHKGRIGARRVAEWLLLMASIGVIVGMAIHYRALWKERQNIESVLAGQQTLSAGKDIDAIELELRKAAAVIEQLSFPWDRLFRTLEASSDENVVLLSVHPDAASKVVRLEAEAKDWNAMLDYMRRLGDNGLLGEVHLVSHQIQQADPNGAVRFTLVCERRK